MERLAKLLPLFSGIVAASAPAYLLRFSVLGIPTTALEIMIYGFVSLTLLSQWGRFRPLPRAVVWPIILFLLAAVVSTAIAPDKQAALGILKAWIFAPLLFAWALWQLPDRRATITSVITGLVAGALFVSFVAIVQRSTGDLTVDGRVVGPYAWFPAENASPNYLALYLAPIGVLAAGIGIGSLAANRRRGLLGLLAAAIIVLAIYFSFSRAGLAAFALGTGSIFVVRSWAWIRANRIALIGLAVLLITLMVGAWFLVRPDPTLSPEEGGRITASNNVRWEIWKTTGELLQMSNDKFQIPNWVLGLGLGNYQSYFTELTRGRVNYDRIAPLALTPHNLFLAFWVNFGLLGLVAALWLLVDVSRRACRQVQSWTAAALLGALVALAAHGLLDTPYFKNDLSLLFWTLIALLVMWFGSLENQRARS